MSETLDSLIRLHRWQVDERRRQVADLEMLAQTLRQELARLVEERAAESEVAGGNLLARHVYPGHVRRALQRQKTLEQSLAETEHQTAEARAVLAEAVQELRRYEVAYANRQRLRLTAAARRERIQTGVIALENYRRRASGT